MRLDGATVIDVVAGTSGLDRAVHPETVFRVYCTIKPVLAVAVAAHVAAGRIDLDAPLADLLERPTRLPLEITTRTVLTHTAGLHRTTALSMELLTPRRREAVVASARPPSGWRIGRDAGYSEYVGWHLLGWLVQEVTGEPLREHLRSTVLDPLGLRTTWIGMTRDQFRGAFPDLGLNHEFHNGQMFPMIAERSERMACETNPAHGGYTTARDLARFYDGLLDRLSGAGSDALAPPSTLVEFCSTARPSTYDVVLGRECRFGLGFMTALGEHRFGDACSPAAFGHSGNVGSSFGFADPTHHLSVGVVFNGLTAGDAALLRRRRLVDAIYDDLGLTGDRASPTPSIGTGR